MATPTITSSGTAGDMILVTDSYGTEFNVYKSNAAFIDSSNANISRIDFQYHMREITLIFENSGEVSAFITAMRALY